MRNTNNVTDNYTPAMKQTQPLLHPAAAPANSRGTNPLLRLVAICGVAASLVLSACGGGGDSPTGVQLAAGGGTGGSRGPAAGRPLVPVTEAPVLAADQTGCAPVNNIDVGPGAGMLANLSDVPWSTLKGCDTVRIFPKAGNLPYREMILISAGTDVTPTAPNQFMRVVGMQDANGNRPIIDGTNATQLETVGGVTRGLRYHDTFSTPNQNGTGGPALYKFGIVMVSAQLGYNYSKGPPAYVSIENLDIRNADYNGPFVSNSQPQATDNYDAFTACLYIEAAQHVVIKNNIMQNCGNGMFINSKGGALVELSQDILVDGNRMFNNGNPKIVDAAGKVLSGGFSEHNSYTEAQGIIFQNNFFGNMRNGGKGDCLKDRSSGLIVRYNTFTSDCGLPLHLVDPTGGEKMISDQPDFGQTYVYGNLFDRATPPAASGPAHSSLVLYGGDSYLFYQYRKGTLFFNNNTVIVRGDHVYTQYPEAFWFNLQQPEAIAEVRNNVFYSLPETPGDIGKVQTFAYGAGTVNMANNWVSPTATKFWAGQVNNAFLTGWETNIGTANNPQFVDEAQHDYRPAAGSPLINAGTGLAGFYTPSSQPAGSLAAVPTPRPLSGTIDLGAFEF